MTCVHCTLGVPTDDDSTWPKLVVGMYCYFVYRTAYCVFFKA